MLKETLQITSHGIPFVAVLSLEDEPTVAFYDARYDFTEYGQFTGGSYYVSTLNEGESARSGLNLHGGVPDWQINAAEMEIVMDWIDKCLSDHAKSC
jgi:hypothetical protein